MVNTRVVVVYVECTVLEHSQRTQQATDNGVLQNTVIKLLIGAKCSKDHVCLHP